MSPNVRQNDFNDFIGIPESILCPSCGKTHKEYYVWRVGNSFPPLIEISWYCPDFPLGGFQKKFKIKQIILEELSDEEFKQEIIKRN